MDFVSWLLTKQIKKDTAVGDVARDVQTDRCLPSTARTPEAVLAHIRWQHKACQEARTALAHATQLWQAYQARQARRIEEVR